MEVAVRCSSCSRAASGSSSRCFRCRAGHGVSRDDQRRVGAAIPVGRRRPRPHPVENGCAGHTKASASPAPTASCSPSPERRSLMLVLSNVWMAATHWAELRFARGRHHSFSVRLLRHYLAQSYVFFLRRNSADLAKNILAEVITGRALMPAAGFTAKSWWRSRSSRCWSSSTLGLPCSSPACSVAPTERSTVHAPPAPHASARSASPQTAPVQGGLRGLRRDQGYQAARQGGRVRRAVHWPLAAVQQLPGHGRTHRQHAAPSVRRAGLRRHPGDRDISSFCVVKRWRRPSPCSASTPSPAIG